MLDMKSLYICGQHKHFTRMSPTDFGNLLSSIGSRISKEETQFAMCSQTAVQTRSCHDAVPTWTEHPFVFVEKTDSRRIRTSGSRAVRSSLGTPSELRKSGSRAVALQVRLTSVYACHKALVWSPSINEWRTHSHRNKCRFLSTQTLVNPLTCVTSTDSRCGRHEWPTFVGVYFPRRGKSSDKDYQMCQTCVRRSRITMCFRTKKMTF
jgi:hypothetical protein